MTWTARAATIACVLVSACKADSDAVSLLQAHVVIDEDDNARLDTTIAKKVTSSSSSSLDTTVEEKGSSSGSSSLDTTSAKKVIGSGSVDTTVEKKVTSSSSSSLDTTVEEKGSSSGASSSALDTTSAKKVTGSGSLDATSAKKVVGSGSVDTTVAKKVSSSSSLDTTAAKKTDAPALDTTAAKKTDSSTLFSGSATDFIVGLKGTNSCPDGYQRVDTETNCRKGMTALNLGPWKAQWHAYEDMLGGCYTTSVGEVGLNDVPGKGAAAVSGAGQNQLICHSSGSR